MKNFQKIVLNYEKGLMTEIISGRFIYLLSLNIRTQMTIFGIVRELKKGITRQIYFYKYRYRR